MATRIVPIAYLKAALGVVGSGEDTLLEQLEAKAAAWVEEQTGKRYFGTPREATEYAEGKNATRLILRGHIADPDEVPTVTEQLTPSSTPKAFTEFQRRGDVLVRTDGQPWYAGAEYAVSYDEGYPTGDAPGDIQQLVVALVEKMRDIALDADGIQSETIGDYSYSLEADAVAGGSLRDIEKATLNRWRRSEL